MKTGAIVAIAVVMTVTAIFGGCYGLNRFICSRVTCEIFNIDNIEIRTATNVKDATDTWCQYNTATRTKNAIFKMSIPPGGIHGYIGINGFSKNCDTPRFTSIPRWNDTLQNKTPHLYYKRGSYKQDKWLLIFDTSTTTLWVELSQNAI